MVNEEKQIFHCFGCGEGGDVFTFLMKVGHLSFLEAVEGLAKRFGVTLPVRESSPGQKREMAKRELLFQINQMASEYFHDLLTRYKEGEEGRKYLLKRGISQEVIFQHRLGYASDHWEGLLRYLQERKAPLELAWELGLISPKKRGIHFTTKEGGGIDSRGWYDAFRGRILFPIFDLHQRVVGFGGRLIREGEPKYLNSHESSIYHKGENLYGLQVAKRWVAEKDCVIIVEGYFDLLTLHQYGLKHSVATLGTALTTHHVRTLKRYTKNFITLFDGDHAGIKASLRCLPLFLEEEIMGKIAILPSGEDPDGFLRKGNLKDLIERIEHATPLLDFFFEDLMNAPDRKSVEGKARMAKEGLAILDKISDKIRRGFYVKHFAERLGISESFFYERLQSSHKSPFNMKEELRSQRGERNFPKSEEMVIRLMIHHPEFIPILSREGILPEFENSCLKKIGEGLEELYQRRGRIDLPEVLTHLDEDLKGRLMEFAFQEGGLEGNDEKILNDCIQKIREERIKREKKELLRKIKEAEEKREDEKLLPLLKERQELAKREKGLQGDLIQKR